MREGGQRQGSAGKPGELPQSQVLPLVKIASVMGEQGLGRACQGKVLCADFHKDLGTCIGPREPFFSSMAPVWSSKPPSSRLLPSTGLQQRLAVFSAQLEDEHTACMLQRGEK